MPQNNPTYTVQQLADAAGVSVRTLHHYHAINLLPPSARSDAGYRLYSEADLLLLQQILFYRELDIPLKDISRMVAQQQDPSHLTQSLLNHHRTLVARIQRLQRLQTTIEQTVIHIQKHTMPPDINDLYEGFSQEKIQAMEAEVDRSYNPATVAQSRHRVQNMSKAQWHDIKAEASSINADLAALIHLPVESKDVQALVARHHAWIENFYDCDRAIYEGLAHLYVDNPEFTLYYDSTTPGLARFLSTAMRYYAARNLS